MKIEKKIVFEKVRKKWQEPQLQGARMNETLKDHRNYGTNKNKTNN
jgi:hypothetical protein